MHRASTLTACLALVAYGCRCASGLGEPVPAAGVGKEGDDVPPEWARYYDKEAESKLGPGRWRVHREEDSPDDTSETIRLLESIGYVSGSRPAHGRAGVTVHDVSRAFEGYNLYTSGHAPTAVLMDMEGRTLHTWSASFWKAFPGFDTSRGNENTQFLRRVHLYESGDLLAIYEGLGLVRLDRSSNVVWANPCHAHHDLEVMPDGDIYVLTREGKLVPSINAASPILEEYITVLGSDGREKRRVSIPEALERSPDYRHIIWTGEKKDGDMFHTNTLHVLDGRIADRIPAFRKGNVLISILWLDAIAVVDMEMEQVVWAYWGGIRAQHDPKVLANGNILLFNNMKTDTSSSVMEMDPVTREIVWDYTGDDRSPFFTWSCGAAERLPNGNTLVTESDNGRAFEVTAGKEIVWEFVNPHRAGNNKKYVATLFELVRLGPDFPVSWALGEAEP